MTEIGDAGPVAGEQAGEQAGDGDNDSVGAALARARQARSLSIADVAQQLKFAARQIEAVEQDRYDQLPTGTFARGMVRAYAKLLKLDPAPLVERIAARTATPDNAAAVATVRRPIPITDNRNRVNIVYAALSLAILGIIAGVVWEWQHERAGADGMIFVPAARMPAEAQRTEVASAVPALNPSPLPQPEPVAPAVKPANDGKGGKKRIVMKFERTSWVEIRGRDGKPLISQLNEGGTEQTVEGRPPFAVIIGNAQFVRLSYDDRPVDLAPHVKVEVARFTLD